MKYFAVAIDEASEAWWGGELEADNCLNAWSRAHDRLKKSASLKRDDAIRVIGIIEMPASGAADAVAASLIYALGARHHQIIQARRARG